jgi:hypothetical protein
LTLRVKNKVIGARALVASLENPAVGQTLDGEFARVRGFTCFATMNHEQELRLRYKLWDLCAKAQAFMHAATFATYQVIISTTHEWPPED